MRGLTKQFANPPRKTGTPFYGDPDTIKHCLLNGDILMKNKKGTKNKGECPLPRSENERKSDCSLQNAERMSVPAFSRRAEEQRMSKKRHCRDFGSANCFASAVTTDAWRTSRT